MRIQRIEYIITGTGADRTWMFVEVHTNNGVTGVGEASQSRLDKGVAAELEMLAPYYIGHDPFTIIEDRARLLRRPDATRTRHCAVSAMEHALWDICGQVAGKPVYNLLGGPVRKDALLYANVALAVKSWTPEPVARAVEAAVAQGFKAVKFNLFPADAGRGPLLSRDARRKGLDNAIAIVREARDAAGPDVEILTDWTLAVLPTEARIVADAIADYNVGWIEEPFVLNDPAELAALRQVIRPRLAVGEQMLKRTDFRPILEARAADVLMPDVKWIGGILEARKLAAMADAFEVEITPHNMSGPVATAASVHLAAVCTNFLILEYCWGTEELRNSLVGDSEAIVDGAIPLPTRPGLGLTWDPARARKGATATGVAAKS